MPEENTDQNKIEVRKAAEVYLERRRAPRISTQLGELEEPPDLVAFWRVRPSTSTDTASPGVS